MSRYTRVGDRYELSYGIDRAPAIGPFVQVFDRAEPDEPLVDLDRLGGVEVTAEMILELGEKYEVGLDAETVRRRMRAKAPDFTQPPGMAKICDEVLRLAQKERGEA